MTARATRLDAELVRRGLARSRTRAARLVADGQVSVAGVVVTRAAHLVAPEDAVEVEAQDDGYVSRAAHKLAGALDALASVPGAPDPRDRRCLDAGASTGGFTQVLLQRGAAHVLAVDVGHGQLDPALARDPRVDAREGVNVRDLTPADVGEAPRLVVADLSFISLTLVVDALVAVAAPGADLVLMVKPQFEVGRERLGHGGVVTSPELRHEAVVRVADAALAAGARVHGVVPSPLPGPSGNREYFLWLTSPEGATTATRQGIHVRDAARRAVVEGATALVATGVHGVPRRTA